MKCIAYCGVVKNMMLMYLICFDSSFFLLDNQNKERLLESRTNQLEQTTKSKSQGTSSEQAKKGYTLQTKYIKEHEHVFVVINIVPLLRSRARTTDREEEKAVPFTRLTFADCVQKSLNEMHGVIGSSFERDLILFEQSGNSTLAIFKVAHDHAQTLTSVISGGVQIKSNTGIPFVTQFAGLLSSFNLSAVRAMISNDHSQNQQRHILQPPGRAWMQAQFSSN